MIQSHTISYSVLLVDAKHRRMRCWIVGYTEHDGSSAPTFRRGNEQVDGGSTQGQNQTAELEGTSGREDNGFIQTDISDNIPTPTTQEIEHPEAELTLNNRRLSKDGKTSHSLNLADSVKMWRTPTAECC